MKVVIDIPPKSQTQLKYEAVSSDCNSEDSRIGGKNTFPSERTTVTVVKTQRLGLGIKLTE